MRRAAAAVFLPRQNGRRFFSRAGYIFARAEKIGGGKKTAAAADNAAGGKRRKNGGKGRRIIRRQQIRISHYLEKTAVADKNGVKSVKITLMNKQTESAAPSKKSAPKNFETALDELEKIAARLEQGGAPLDEMTAMYERGAVLVEYCKSRLNAARGKIQKLEKQTLGGMDDVGE